MELEAANVEMRKGEIKCHPNPGHPDLPSFSVKTIHISCKSDAYRGTAYDYAGVIIYSCNGKSEWQTANGTRCKSGYLVIMDTETEKVRKYLGESPGCVHGAVYRSAFGEQRKEGSVIAEGFSVRKGVFKINSGVFNWTQDDYHDQKKSMNRNTAHCVEKVINYWKEAGKDYLRCQNVKIQDLLNE